MYMIFFFLINLSKEKYNWHVAALRQLRNNIKLLHLVTA